MEPNFLLTEEMIWDYVDELLTPEENARIEAALAQNPAWKARVAAIRQEKKALFAFPMEHPDHAFADRVMAAWAGEQFQLQSKKIVEKQTDWVVRSIALAFGIIILAPLALLVAAILQSAPIEVPQFQLPTVDLSGWTSLLDNSLFQTGLIALLAIALLQVLDRYFHHRVMAIRH